MSTSKSITAVAKKKYTVNSLWNTWENIPQTYPKTQKHKIQKSTKPVSAKDEAPQTASCTYQKTSAVILKKKTKPGNILWQRKGIWQSMAQWTHIQNTGFQRPPMCNLKSPPFPPLHFWHLSPSSHHSQSLPVCRWSLLLVQLQNSSNCSQKKLKTCVTEIENGSNLCRIKQKPAKT